MILLWGLFFNPVLFWEDPKQKSIKGNFVSEKVASIQLRFCFNNFRQCHINNPYTLKFNVLIMSYLMKIILFLYLSEWDKCPPAGNIAGTYTIYFFQVDVLYD
jgi:hypothetical protein